MGRFQGVSTGALAIVAGLVASAAIEDAAAADATAISFNKGSLYFSADAVFASRKTSDSQAVVIRPLAGPGVTYRPGMTSLPFVTGADVRAGWQGAKWGAEGRFLGGFSWSGGNNLGAVGDVQIGSFSNFGAVGLTADIASHLDTAEFNLRFAPQPGLNIFGGVRWMHFRDVFHANITFPAFSALYEMASDTTGWGPQIGAEGRFGLNGGDGRELAFVKLDARGGVFLENNTNAFSLTPSTGGGFTGGASGNTTSGFVEAGVTLGHQFGEHFSVQAGYRALYIQKVPTGAGNMANATATLSQSNPPVYDSLLVQAWTVGGTAKF